MILKGKQLDEINRAIKEGGDVNAAFQKTCIQANSIGQKLSPEIVNAIIELERNLPTIRSLAAQVICPKPSSWDKLADAMEVAIKNLK